MHRATPVNVHKGGCVLVVDDDPQVRATLSEALRAEGYTVTTAENGDVALSALRSGQIDVVILDLVMPVMSGLDFLERRNAYTPGADAPVIIVSGTIADSVLPTLERLGVHAHFNKPFDLADLLDCIASVVYGKAA